MFYLNDDLINGCCYLWSPPTRELSIISVNQMEFVMNKKCRSLNFNKDFFAELDINGHLKFINRYGRDLLGIPIDFDINKEDIFAHEILKKTNFLDFKNQVLPLTLSEGVWQGVMNFRSLCDESIPMQLEMRLCRDKCDGDNILTLIGHDLRLQHAFMLQEAITDNFLAMSSEGIIVTDKYFRILKVNPAFNLITEYLHEEVTGRTPRFLFTNDSQDFYKTIYDSLNQKGVWQGEIWCRRKSGDIILLFVSISKLHFTGSKTSHYLSVFHDLTEKRAKDAEIAQLAFINPITGMGNRYSLIQTITQRINRVSCHIPPLAIMCVDLGQISPINDRFGMRGGDELIRRQGLRLQQLGEGLRFFHLAGDQFVILVPDASDLTNIGRYADNCIKHLQKPIVLEGEQIMLSPSIGVALLPKDAQDADTLMACAQTAMIAAKEQGREVYCFYNQAISDLIRQRLMLAQQLRLAMQADSVLGLELYLQPKVTLPTGQIQGAEVLLRWNHPEYGMIAPSEFIPLAEESRLIVTLDRWVFANACHALKRWRLSGFSIPHISINLSARQLQEPDLVNWCIETASSYGLSPDNLELEITETGFINLADTVLMQLQALRHAGFSLALDDFGTGYSSLTYLRRLPLDVVKIDRSFIADLCHDDRAATMLQGVLQLVKSLGYSVVAEGIETDEQVKCLQAIECDTMQGFLFYPPMPADDFITLYQDHCSIMNDAIAGKSRKLRLFK